MDLTLVLPGLLLVATLFVFLPVCATVFRHFRYRKLVRCPVTDHAASVAVAAGRAAMGAAFGRETFRIQACSLWDEHDGCPEACQSLLLTAPDDAGKPANPTSSVPLYADGHLPGEKSSRWHPFVFC